MNTMIHPHIDLAPNLCSQHQIQKIVMFGREQCPTCAIEYVRQNNKQHVQEVQKSLKNKHFSTAMIPKRHFDSVFKNYDAQLPGQINALKQTTEFAKKVLHGKVENFVMLGRTGTGKTHLACALAKALLNKDLYVRCITSEALAKEIMGTWARPDESENNMVARYTAYDLLILDEYGLLDREKRLELVHKVLYSRYDAGKPTMLISNMTLVQIQKDLGDRLWSRFQHGGLTIVECNWADARIGGAV